MAKFIDDFDRRFLSEPWFVVQNGAQIDIHVRLDGRELNVLTKVSSRAAAEFLVRQHNKKFEKRGN